MVTSTYIKDSSFTYSFSSFLHITSFLSRLACFNKLKLDEDSKLLLTLYCLQHFFSPCSTPIFSSNPISKCFNFRKFFSNILFFTETNKSFEIWNIIKFYKQVWRLCFSFKFAFNMAMLYGIPQFHSVHSHSLM